LSTVTLWLIGNLLGKTVRGRKFYLYSFMVDTKIRGAATGHPIRMKLRNIEIKARVEDLDSVAARAAKLASGPPTPILQDDTFFPCAAGRLKLRDFLDGSGELIFYRRANERGPKESFYVRSPTSSPDSLRESLSLAYGQLGRVKKHRTLFLIGRTRLHLDEVSALGTFVELEVVLEDKESSENGVREAQALMTTLNIGAAQLIDCAYIDLLEAKYSTKDAQS
jgi:adenylate cyclase class IV